MPKSKPTGPTDEEKAAMREYAAERRKQAAGKNDEQAVMEAIDKMAEPDKALAKRIHAIVMKAAPRLVPRTWYGMPAYAKDGNVVCFFQNAGKFKARYSTLGFSDKANLDDGNVWPSSYAIAKLTAADEKRIAELVKRAMR